MKKAKINKFSTLILLIILSSISAVNIFGKDCFPTPPNPELIINGNFELGFKYFKTTYDTSFIKFPKNVKITSNPYNEYYTFDSCADPVTPNGKFLVVNGNDIFDGLHIVWEQEVNVIPNNYYEFKYMYCNIDARVDTNKNLPIIQISFNEEFFDTVFVPKETCQWLTRSFIWYSGNNNKLVIRFRDLQLKYFGNDFALDEISLKSLCSIQACAGQNQEICSGDTVVLGDISNKSAIQGFKPYKFKWTPTEGLDNPYSPNPLAFPNKTTTYLLEVTDSLGCIATDSVTVTVHFRPLARITLNKNLPICPCDSITLSATEGLKYFWSTGDTVSSILVKETGYYSLRVQNHFGCIDTTGIWVEVYQVSTTLKFDTITANIGEKITLPLRLVSEKNHFICNYDSFTVIISYNPTVLFPMNFTPVLNDGTTEKIVISGRSIYKILDTLLFFVTLGNDTSSIVTIESFHWDCDKVTLQTINGKVVINDICKEGGNRLFDLQNKPLMLKILNVTSEEIEINFSAIERGLTKVKIVNYMGKEVLVGFNNYIEAGNYFLKLDRKSLGTGIYFLILETPSINFVEKLILLN